MARLNHGIPTSIYLSGRESINQIEFLLSPPSIILNILIPWMEENCEHVSMHWSQLSTSVCQHSCLVFGRSHVQIPLNRPWTLQ